MIILLVVLNVILLCAAAYLLYKNRKDISRSGKLFSDLEDIDLIEFQQNLKALIEELNRVARTNVAAMESKKAETELMIKSADVRISEIKYLIERNQLKRQAEYKGEINETIRQESAAITFEQGAAQKEPQGLSRMMITGMEETFPETPAAEAKAPAKDKYQHINGLIKNGLSVEEIAKVTGLTRGEIELVRNIKKQS
jgi:hypothetical protein